MLAINKKLDIIKDEFSIFSDPRDKYIYLVDLAKESKGLKHNEKIEENRIQGCTSQAWVIKQKRDDQLYFKTDSDAMIVKGLLSLIERSFNGHLSHEIIEIDGLFLTLNSLYPIEANNIASLSDMNIPGLIIDPLVKSAPFFLIFSPTILLVS